ncbi:MAG: CDP-alcohol phosphatidyltransferase family protein [Pirellulaceae bacterium]
MLDITVRQLIDPPLERIADVLMRLRISANQLTWIGFAAGMLGGLCIVEGWFSAAFVCITLNRLFDGLDGCVARLRGATDVGGFLDIALDMVFYSTIPFAFALYSQENQLASAFLIYSFMGTGSSFLAFAVISAKRGKIADDAGKKSFFYSRGLIEGTETALFLWLVCILPEHFANLAWTFGGLCWLTTCIRIATACSVFRTSQHS